MISLQTRMDIDISQPEILSYIMLGNEYFPISTLGWMFIIFPQSFDNHEHIHTCNDKFGHLSRGGPSMNSKIDT